LYLQTASGFEVCAQRGVDEKCFSVRD
jgi:hypothetical protein